MTTWLSLWPVASVRPTIKPRMIPIIAKPSSVMASRIPRRTGKYLRGTPNQLDDAIPISRLHEAHPIHRVLFYKGWRQLAELEFGHAHPDFPMAVLPQARTEALLSDALAARGVVPERGTALGSFAQDAAASMPS